MPLLHHPLHLLQMPDGPGQPVDDRSLVFMDMSVAVGDAVGMEIGMVVLLFLMEDIFIVFFHCCTGFLCFSAYYTPFPAVSQALPGDISQKRNVLTDGCSPGIIEETIL